MNDSKECAEKCVVKFFLGEHLPATFRVRNIGQDSLELKTWASVM